MNNTNKRIPTPFEQKGIIHAIKEKYGIVADTDSYKISHKNQYIKDADMMVSYFEARGGDFDKVLNFGAEMLCKEYFLQRLTKKQVKNMIRWAHLHMNGNMTDDLEIALNVVVSELDGVMPIRIRNAKEGLMIPIKNVVLTIETTVPDKRLFSLVSFFETKIVRIWKTMTVGTTTYYVRQAILKALEQSADEPQAEINYKFHDFGSRAVSGMEDAAFSGAAHLVNSMGTDTVVAVMAVEMAYGEEMAGYSIPASEHSSTCSHGLYNEIDLVTQMFDAYAVQGGIFSTVADSYDLIKFIRNITPLFKERLLVSGATWVIRPDSCDPILTPIQCVIELEKVFGTAVNSKGYKVLNNVRVIQGDGIVPTQITEILDKLMELGFSASNMAFGMGGGLLQKVNRDTHKFALKCSAIHVNGSWLDVYKEPAVYDENWNKIDQKSFKTSKKGRQELIYNKNTDEYKTIRVEIMQAYLDSGWEQALETVMEDGCMVRETPFTEIRQNSGMVVLYSKQ